jgi:putative ABC transport system permease protein
VALFKGTLIRSGVRRFFRLPLRTPDLAREDADRELDGFIAEREDYLVSRGMSPEDAHAEAVRRLGGSLDRAREQLHHSAEIRERRMYLNEIVDDLRRDVRYAARKLRRSPGFAAVAVLTLSLGIGANTVLFSVADAVLLRALPFHEPKRLATFWGTSPERGLPVVAYPEALFTLIAERSRTTESMAAFTGGGFSLTGDGEPERIQGSVITRDFFKVLGVNPMLGRALNATDAVSDTATAVVISHALWQRRFGSDSSLVGRTIRINEFPVVVVGVMPAGFDFPDRAELWGPLPLHADRFSPWYLSTVARLKPGFTAGDLKREVEAITDDIALSRRDVFPNARRGGSRVVSMPLDRHIIGDVRPSLLLLLGAGATFLLIACANIANLQLARASARERELALRCCLGATRRRIATQFLTENLVLAGASAIGGVLLASVAASAIGHLPARLVPRLDQLQLNPMVVAFSIALAVGTGVLFGVAPALRASRVDLQEGLASGSRGSAGMGTRRLSDAFVVAQFAMSLVLLVGTGLLLRSFHNILSVNPGYRVEKTLVARLQLPDLRYRSDTSVRAFFDQLTDRLSAVPGVLAAGLATRVPLTPGNPQDNIIAEGYQPAAGEPDLVANVRFVTAGYFAAIGTPIVRGRSFDRSDGPSSVPVAVVDETLARHFWRGSDALGKRIRYRGDPGRNPWMTVVGIAPNVKHSGLTEQPSLQVYQPFAQQTHWGGYIVVRSAGDPDQLVRAVRAQVATLDPSLPLSDAHTMEQALDRSLLTRRLTGNLLGGFAVAALLLAAIGIYGVVSLNVSARVREFGVRLALGAQRGQVLRMVVRQGVLLASAGVAIGVLGAVWLTRYVRALLFGVGQFDAWTFAGVAGVLTVVGLAACLVPAWRAMRVDVTQALRAE